MQKSIQKDCTIFSRRRFKCLSRNEAPVLQEKCGLLGWYFMQVAPGSIANLEHDLGLLTQSQVLQN